jgi:hypothetical protein
MRKRMSLLSVLGVLAGCGGESGGLAVDAADVTGSWNAVWQGMNAPGVSCSADGGRLDLTSTGGGGFTGSFQVTTLTCNGSTGRASSGAVVNGNVFQDQVVFDLNDASFHQTGRVSGDAMSGQATWTLVISGTAHTVIGTWTAERTCRTASPTAFSC